MRALVIGGGVSGLTSALALQEHGWRVTLASREWAPRNVSSVAAAFWLPYRAEHAQAQAWALETLAHLRELARAPETGVRLVEVRKHTRFTREPPTYVRDLDAFASLARHELKLGYAGGWKARIPLIQTPIHLAWLRAEATRRGITMETREIATLRQIEGPWDVIVNCTGLGARDLVGDRALFPIRGQVLKLPPKLTDHVAFDDDRDDQPTYVVPRDDGTIVGGTAIAGDWNEQPRPAATRDIRERARLLHSALWDQPVLDVSVGLRPGRATVRLEAEDLDGRLVIHNYGHGGSGFTLSWGCASEVARLAARRSGPTP